LVSTITLKNADELIEFCRTHTHRETEKELARINPKRRKPDKIKYISETDAEVSMTVSVDSIEIVRKTQDNEAQKGKILSIGQTYELALKRDFERHDPIKKAERAEVRKQAKAKKEARVESATDAVSDFWAPRDLESENGVKSETYEFSCVRNDEPVPAHIKHALNLRDQGECTHINEKGERCRETRWTDTHHIIPRGKGGPNTLENLTTLCSFHHDMVHQLVFPMEGAFNQTDHPAN
jgi:hypothetical protein